VQDDIIKHIFLTILKAFIVPPKFQKALIEHLSKIISMTLNVYNEVIKRLLPTPDKSFYTFNMRDVSKLI